MNGCAGIPAYAVTWTLANASNSGVGAATIGAGNAGPYTAFKGTLSFYEVPPSPLKAAPLVSASLDPNRYIN